MHSACLFRLLMVFSGLFAVAVPPAAEEVSCSAAPERQIQEEALPLNGSKATRSPLRQPLTFERNEGQLDPEVKFVVRRDHHSVFLTGSEAVLVLHEPPVRRGLGLERQKAADSPTLYHSETDGKTAEPGWADEEGTGHRVMRMRFAGANQHASAVGESPLRGRMNYFVGNDPSRWRTDIATFGRVRFHEVYPGIDLVYYHSDGGLEYDLVLAPGVAPCAVALEFEGADKVRLDASGDLVLTAGPREVRWRTPVVFQEAAGIRRQVQGRYRVWNDLADPKLGDDWQSAQEQEIYRVTFELGEYDPELALVIDPKLVFSTYFGGERPDTVYGSVAVDGENNIYLVGDTESPDFPTRGELFSPRGDKNAFVSKFSPSGELLFSTYLGGSSADGGGGVHEKVLVAIDQHGRCFVAGSTESTDFPLMNPLQDQHGGQAPGLGGNSDVFVSALSLDGSALLFSTFLGGSHYDEPYALAVNQLGDLFVVGSTKSSNFPVRNAIQSQLTPVSQGVRFSDGFLTKLEAGGKSILYSTYYGQMHGNDYVWDVAVDEQDYLFFTVLACDTWPCRTVIVKLNPDGSEKLFESSVMATVPMLALARDRLVLAGSTGSGSLPALNEPSPATDPWSEGYVALFDKENGSFISAVYLGGHSNERLRDIIVTPVGDIIVVGWTASSDFPVRFPLQAEKKGETDLFITQLRLDDLSIIFSTLLGGMGGEDGDGIALDSNSDLIVAGSTTSSDFPLVNAYQAAPGGERDAVLLKISFGTQLQVKRSGQEIIISWPAAAGFVLESTPSLGSGSGWEKLQGSPVSSGGENVLVLSVAADNGPRFYRLRQEP